MSGRPMRYPYTFSAKLARFPWEHFYFKAKHGWAIKYWTVSCILLVPLWYQIQKLSYSPENVKKWKKIREEQFSGKMHH